ncbi:MAG TPA: toll/interleukin-1 receptor domain-containing protein [Pyrinomonadaceae bacterium]|jgi:hypothetical protein|nr:toll/interleukin-1 receptor domain-containing protein [Pyrinomonadaceae bacterium]
MANPEHLEILERGVQAWNVWRETNPLIDPDLSGANLKEMELIVKHKVSEHGYVVQGIKFFGTNLVGANLRAADLFRADFRSADLSGADLSDCVLISSTFSYAELKDANFYGAHVAAATFADNDLSEARGLESVTHGGPSHISIDTLYRSGGNIPEAFLRGCGVPDDFITFIPSHFGLQQAIQFYSCFISYSTKDEEFARRLYSQMRDEKLRVWFAPEDVKGGEKLYEQIERAIQVHDRLLLVLSEKSMQSKWVITEIRRARKVEIAENRRKLFPIRLVDFGTLQSWECFDADTGEDLAAEVRQYFIPDFSNWKDHDAFEKAFERLLRDLRAEEKV